MHEPVVETKNDFKPVSRNDNQRISRNLSRPAGVPSSRQLGNPDSCFYHSAAGNCIILLGDCWHFINFRLCPRGRSSP